MRKAVGTVGQLDSEFWFWIPRLAIWVYIFGQGWRHSLISRYPLIFAFVATDIILRTSLFVLRTYLGLSIYSFEYAELYFWGGLTRTLLAGWILLTIYFVKRPVHWKESWHFLVFLSVVAILVYRSKMVLQIGILNGGYLVLTYLGLSSLVRVSLDRTVELGANLRMTLLALTLPACVQSLLWLAYFLEGSINYPYLATGIKWVSLVSWVILAVGMSSYSPPRVLEQHGSKQN